MAAVHSCLHFGLIGSRASLRYCGRGMRSIVARTASAVIGPPGAVIRCRLTGSVRGMSRSCLVRRANLLDMAERTDSSGATIAVTSMPPSAGQRRCATAQPEIILAYLKINFNLSRITRRAQPQVRVALACQAAVAIVGPRQVGKTTLAQIIAEERPSVYRDLEAPEDRAKLADPALFLRSYEDRLVVLDEIHRAPQIFQTSAACLPSSSAAFTMRERVWSPTGHFWSIPAPATIR